MVIIMQLQYLKKGNQEESGIKQGCNPQNHNLLEMTVIQNQMELQYMKGKQEESGIKKGCNPQNHNLREMTLIQNQKKLSFT